MVELYYLIYLSELIVQPVKLVNFLSIIQGDINSVDLVSRLHVPVPLRNNFNYLL